MLLVELGALHEVCLQARLVDWQGGGGVAFYGIIAQINKYTKCDYQCKHT